jgi:hypothetical protein
MLHGEDMISLLLGISGNVIERFALTEQYF